jgi:glutathione S-transferase
MITLFTFGPKFGLSDPSPFVTKSLLQLKMSGLPFDVEIGDLRKAPKGKLPYLRDGDAIIADSAFIQMHLERNYGVDLDEGLTVEQRAAGWAFEKMCEEHLYWAMVDARWSVDANFDRGPRQFFAAAPAPLRPFIVAKVRRDLKRALHGQGFGRHTRSEIEELAERDIDAIARFLGEKDYLFGASPHGVDASIYAFVSGLMCSLFETPIRAAAAKRVNLVAYVNRCTARWFSEDA